MSPASTQHEDKGHRFRATTLNKQKVHLGCLAGIDLDTHLTKFAFVPRIDSGNGESIIKQLRKSKEFARIFRSICAYIYIGSDNSLDV